MAHAEFDRVMQLFDECCDLPPDQQAARVAALGAEEPELADRLREMLRADATPAFLDDTRGAARFLPGLAEPIVGGRWRLRERLGAGSGGEVWSAEDVETGEPVAVKLIHEGLVDDPKLVARFRREFATMARLSHDGCLRLHAEGVVGAGVPLLSPNRRFLVTELVTGGDLSRLILEPPAVILPVLAQLLAALAHLHEQGVVHRDLKPSNVLLTDEQPPRPKLADFGIVKLNVPDGTDLTGDEALLGTVDYLSPEQVRGEPLDPRSDLYAFGCLIHTLWTGHPPFDGPIVNRLVARVRVDAPSLAVRAPHAPASLVALTDALLSRDRERRPASAWEVADRLKQVLAEVEASPPATAPKLFPTGVVGREGLIEHVMERGREARRASGPVTICLLGPAGVGKTTVAEATLRRLEADGWGVYVAPPMPLGAAPPFWPIPALVERLSGAREVAPRHTDPGPLAREASARAARHLAEQLARAVEEAGPAALLIEDIHAASRAALDVLREAHAIAEERNVACVILSTARPSGRERLGALPKAEPLAVPPLDASGSVQLAERLLGAAHGKLSSTFVDRWLPEIAGNPLLLRAALQNLLDQGALTREDGRWQVRTGATLGDAVSDVLDRRLDGLSDASRRVLTAAATVGRRFDARLLAEVLGSEDDVARGLDEGLRRSLILEEDGEASDGATHRFEHGRLSERLVARAPAPELTALHDAIGRALLSRSAGAARLAHHLGRGSDAALAERYLRLAADEAKAANDHGARARHLAALLARPDVGEVADVAAIREEHADALAVGGEPEAALAELNALERDDLPPLVRARLLRKRGLVYLRTAEPAAGLQALRRSLALLEGTPPRTRPGRLARLASDAAQVFVGRSVGGAESDAHLEERAIVHRELALLYRWIDLYDCAGHLASFSRLARRLAPRHYRVDADGMVSMLFALSAFPSLGARFERSARELATETGDLEGLTRLTVIQGGCEVMLLDSDASLRRLDEGVRLAHETGDRMLVSFALAARAWARGLVGHVPDAHAEFEHAEHEALECGAHWLAADAKCGRALGAAAMGRFDEARRLASEILVSDLRLTFPIFESLAVETLAGVALLEGRYVDATAGYERAYDVLRRNRLDDGWGWLLPMSRVEALCSLADVEGRDAVPDLVRRLRGVLPTFRRMNLLPLYRGCGDVARGVIEARRGRADEARRRFERGIARRRPGRSSHIDTWVHARTALERLRLGEDRDRVAADLDRVDREYAARGLEGMQAWLATMRRHVGA